MIPQTLMNFQNLISLSQQVNACFVHMRDLFHVFKKHTAKNGIDCLTCICFFSSILSYLQCLVCVLGRGKCCSFQMIICFSFVSSVATSNHPETDYKNKDWVFINYTYKRFEGLTARGAIPSYMKAGKWWTFYLGQLLSRGIHFVPWVFTHKWTFF